VSGPDLYDVLDVDRDASTAEIRAAWRAAIEDLTPADRRFRLYNEAAEVLLDDERRAAYDATLEPVEPEPETEPVPVPDEDEAAPAPTGDRRLPLVPVWLLAGLAVLAVLAVGLAVHLLGQPTEDAVEEATGSARAAAERDIVPVLSYDYRTLDDDQAAAHDVITSDYREDDYDPLFEVIRDNADETETVVDVEVIASSVVRAGDERAEILLFVNRPTTNARTEEPVVYRDQVTVSMQRVDGEWKIDGLTSSPIAG
jgi:Mce-associated membrane protein